MVWIILSMALMVGADQYIKKLVLDNIALYEEVPFIKGVVRLTYIENSGAAFGMGQNMTMFFSFMTIAVVAAIVVYLFIRRKNAPLILKTCLAMIAGGGIGNLIDRLVRGSVVDMFEFEFIRFPVFNFADIMVSIGTVLLCIIVFFMYDKCFPEKDSVKEEGKDD